MSTLQVLLLAFLIGVVAGLRSLTAPAVVAWAAHLSWLNLHSTLVSFMASTITVTIFTLLGAVELVTDQLPSTPSRIKPAGLIPRLLFGALSGACIAVAGSQSMAFGATLGALGGFAGAFGGYLARTGLVKALKVPDFVIACIEDGVTIAAGLFIVSRF